MDGIWRDGKFILASTLEKQIAMLKTLLGEKEIRISELERDYEAACNRIIDLTDENKRFNNMLKPFLNKALQGGEVKETRSNAEITEFRTADPHDNRNRRSIGKHHRGRR